VRRFLGRLDLSETADSVYAVNNAAVRSMLAIHGATRLMSVDDNGQNDPNHD